MTDRRQVTPRHQPVQHVRCESRAGFCVLLFPLSWPDTDHSNLTACLTVQRYKSSNLDFADVSTDLPPQVSLALKFHGAAEGGWRFKVSRSCPAFCMCFRHVLPGSRDQAHPRIAVGPIGGRSSFGVCLHFQHLIQIPTSAFACLQLTACLPGEHEC